MNVYLCRTIPGQMVMTSQRTGIPAESADTGHISPYDISPLLVSQDTLITGGNDSLLRQDTVRAQRFSMEEALRLLEAADLRERQADSLRHAERIRRYRLSQETQTPVLPKIDSSKFIIFDSFLKEVPATGGIERIPGPLPLRPDKVLSYQTERSGDLFYAGDSLPVSEQKTLAVPKSMDISERHSSQTDWVFGVLILSVALFAWIRLFFNRYLSSVFPGLVLYQHGNKLYRESNLLYRRFSFLMNLLFALSGGLFLSLTRDFLSPDIPLPEGFLGFVLFSAGLSGLFFIRFMVCGLVGFFSLAKDLFNEYMHTILLINKALGILLLPLVIGIPYLPEIFAPYLVYGGLGLFALAYLIRVYKALQINMAKGFSLLWMILYLCALEFLPYLLILTYWDTHHTQVV